MVSIVSSCNKSENKVAASYHGKNNNVQSSSRFENENDGNTLPHEFDNDGKNFGLMNMLEHSDCITVTTTSDSSSSSGDCSCPDGNIHDEENYDNNNDNWMVFLSRQQQQQQEQLLEGGLKQQEQEQHLHETEKNKDIERELLRNKARKLFFDILVKQNQQNQPYIFDDEMDHKIYKSLKTIVIMDGDDDEHNPCAQTVLDTFQGKLCTMNESLLQKISSIMPKQPSARVGDFNENISYSMLDTKEGGLLTMFQQYCNHQQQRQINNKQEQQQNETTVDQEQILLKQLVSEFEGTIRTAVNSRRSRTSKSKKEKEENENGKDEEEKEEEKNESIQDQDIRYQGSFLKTEDATIPQPAHVDFTWEYLEEQETDHLYIGFFPLSNEGMFLQFWNDTATTTSCTKEEEEAILIFVPYGKLFLVPAHTIHGGGFRTTLDGNPRFHLYVASHGSTLPSHQQNKYTEKHDKRKELCDRLIDSKQLSSSGKGEGEGLLDLLFV